MARNLQLALSLLARDGASKVLKQAMQDIIKQTRATQKAGDEQAKSQQQNTSSAIRASRTLQDEYRRASSARSSLGIRSEREIRREIQQTQAAYNRLTRAGTMSVNEQSRAFRAMIERVSRLRTELVGVSETMTRMQKIKAVGSTVAAVAGGVTAAAMVIKDPVQRQMAFERTNAGIANTAFNELSPEERKKKIPIINNAIRESVRKGGGTPEAAQSTLGSLFAAGQVDNNTAMKILPDIMKYATATGANPEDLAKIASAGIANFGIKPEDLPTFFDKSVRSSENGSFELSDMAAKLSTQMAAASKLGMRGLQDYDKLLAMNQANALTSGTPDSAATNVENYLNKITSADTQNSMKNYRFRGKDGKTVPYMEYLSQQRSQGVNTSDAFMKAVDSIVSSDKGVQRLRAESKQFQGTEKGNNAEAALKVLISSITSKIIADREAGAALTTNILQREYIKNQISGTRNSTGAGAASFDVISSTNDFKSQQLEAEKMFSEQDSMKPVADLYGDLASKLADYSKEYPELTTAISGATTAIKAMSAAAIAFAGLSFLTGGGVKLPGGIKLPGGGAGGGGVLGRTWGAITKGGGPLKWRIAGPLAAAYAVYDLNNTYDDARDDAGNAGMNTGEFLVNKMKERDKNKKPLFDIDLGKAFSSWWSSPSTIGQVDPATTGVPSYLLPQQPKSQPLTITTKVMLNEREIAQAVNEFNGEQSNRGSTGGPQ
ncbi:TPA: phage tail tape measure protein [Citrobacter freundii]|nr:phage tail tape measure protein [Citrobacter freundii]HBZ9137309.1 phage tail tape measure protein [Citrobacter freundii]HBZ9204337.1 phage tail tape measure protein [Citrobacter freundii]HBZ9208337.1 phage tail tape measure protein [Citrobacter freundii]HBZ9469101.1 phage tail tape measure protein [Citrobacter freundii]